MASAITTMRDRLVVSASRRSAMSEIQKRFCEESSSSGCSRNGSRSMLVTASGIVGDSRAETPSQLTEVRNSVSPTASRLMATPEMMWSTPNTTVAIACSMPPSAPPAMPRATPCHGP
jgi:hypothetical protein